MGAANAVTLDGASDFLGSNYTGNPGAFTVSMYLKPRISQVSSSLFSNFNSSGSTGWVIKYSDTTTGVLGIYNGSFVIPLSSAMTSGTWVHCCITWDGTTFTYYENGTQITALSLSVNYGSVPTNNTMGGLDSGGGVQSQLFDGDMAAVGVWARAVSSGEAVTLYATGGGLAFADLSGALLTSNLVAYYDFADAAHLGADSTSNNHDLATITGTPTQATGPGTAGPVIVNVTASTSIALTDDNTRALAIGEKSVSATTSIVLSQATSRNAIGTPQDVVASATTAIQLLDAASAGDARVVPVTAFTTIQMNDRFPLGGASGGVNATLTASATTTFRVNSSAFEYVSPLNCSSITTIGIKDAAVVVAVNRGREVDATSQIVVLSEADTIQVIRNPEASAANTIKVRDVASGQVQRVINVDATSSLNVYSNIHVSGDRLVSAFTAIAVQDTATKNADIEVAATDTVSLAASAPKRSRDISVTATTSMGFSTDNGSNEFLFPTATATITLQGTAGATIGWNECVSAIVISGVATASVELPGGGSIPGGDANQGLRAVAYPNVSGAFPFSYAETPSGLLLLANGVDPMLRWDGLSGVADTAGVMPPSTAISLGGQDVGTLVGQRYAFCRFVDRKGNVSALGPLSNLVNLGRDGSIEDISIDTRTGLVTLRSTGHGLATGEPLVFQGVNGLPVSGGHYITVVDEDHFYLTNVRLTSGVWTGGGSWTWGVNEVVYSNVPVPVEGKVVRRQILRNLDGSADVFYVDVDTTDLISATLTSTRDDESLAACEAVALTTSNELPYAARYAPPPSHKSIVASHMGRIFACGEVAVTVGNVKAVYGSAVVSGIGTNWPATLAGRLLYVTGAKASYEIVAVDPAAQTLTLTSPYADASQAYSSYAIRPAPGERRLVYYSEPGLPEAWPAWNSFAIPEENDEIVGMFARTGFLYFVEKRHIHRFTMQDEPSEGQIFASINRGCINGRCFVSVENTCYLLDEAGIHAFDGGQATEPISTPIQTIFQSDGLLGGLAVDWAADSTLWHASHDPVRNTIRWFVQMEQFDAIYHAISYDYRQQRWWIEQYPSPVTSSALGVVGYRRALAGIDARRVVVLGEGALDLVADAATGLSGAVTDADTTSLTDANASFPANLAGAPVSVTYGAGEGMRRQQRIIAENTSTQLTIVDPWDVVPDATCEYQVGGVQWSWRSGWFEQLIEEEDTNARDVMLTYQPTANQANIDLQLFYDHSADPKRWAYDIEQDGVSVLAGDPNITLDLKDRRCRAGWSLQRFGGHSEVYAYGEQYLQIYLAGVQCAESIRIFQITLNGVRPPEGS